MTTNCKFIRFILPAGNAAKQILLALVVFHSSFIAFTQTPRVDSLGKLLAVEKTDSNRVRLMWQLARDMGVYDPDSALVLAQKALYLARGIGYTEGESRSLGVLANTFLKIGNYPRALELNIEKLKIEEKRNNPRNLASVLMNTGVVYALEEEYTRALEFYRRSDSVIQLHNLEDIRYNAALNTGDAWDRLNQNDSAFRYFSRSLEIARALDDGDYIGTSMTGLGHSYRKMGMYPESQLNYQEGIRYLQEAQDDEVLCEAALGLAKLFELIKRYDSAGHYANLSLAIAKKDGFLSKELEAAEFLTDHYKKIRDIDSAFTYVSYVRGLNDSVNSKSRIRESQIISSNEQYRQLEREEERSITRKKRTQQLQLLLIAIFIPGFFLITLLLSHINVPVRMIRLLGILSLLFLFEYLTLLLHPTVAALTHHNPIYEILIFVGLAALLIPAHHKLEHWMIHKLTHNREKRKQNPQMTVAK